MEVGGGARNEGGDGGGTVQGSGGGGEEVGKIGAGQGQVPIASLPLIKTIDKPLCDDLLKSIEVVY